MDSRTGLLLQADSRRFDDMADHFHLRIVLEWQVLQSRLRYLLLIRKLSIFLIMNEIHFFFFGATPPDIFTHCQDVSQQRRQNKFVPATPGSTAFSLALYSSDTICSVIRDLSLKTWHVVTLISLTLCGCLRASNSFSNYSRGPFVTARLHHPVCNQAKKGTIF